MNSKLFQSRNCPLCGRSSSNSNSAIQPEIDPIENEQHGLKSWVGFHTRGVFFEYCRCECGLFLYCPNYFNEATIRELTSAMPNNIHSGDERIELKTKIKYISSLLSNKINPKRVLEIGPDNGSFASKFVEKYSDAEIYFVEPNKIMHHELKNISPGEIYTDIGELMPHEKFDLIIAIHVLDHVSDLNQFINKLSSHLSVNGNIFGVVHNEQSMIAKLLRANWPCYCMQHPHLFSPKSLDFLMGRHGLRKIQIKKTINFFGAGYFISSFFRIFFGKKVTMPSLFAISLPLGNFSFLYKK